MLIPVFLASCDLAGATLGICDCGTSVTDQISFELCGTTTVSDQVGSDGEVPMRLCEYYVNGTIDEPTMGRITAWVPVGSRLCIGDEIPELAPPRTISDDLSDAFIAFSSRPWASWEPGGELEVEVLAGFTVTAGSDSSTGSLLGRPASIRFVPTSAHWSFSDGSTMTGFAVSKAFVQSGDHTAVAKVGYRIDYRYDGSDWVVGASSGQLSSNRLELEVVEIPRRTLLISP